MFATQLKYNDDATPALNGNMYKDLNKEIEQIDYNILNLPERIQMTTGTVNHIDYIYDAVGVKWLKETYQGGFLSKTMYK